MAAETGYVVAWVVGGAGLFVGMVLLWVGLRGRRVDEHPVCRRCGFDLVGLPEGSVVCSECGADVKKRGAVKVGHRGRRGGWVWSGVGMIVPSVLWLGAVGWVSVRNVDVYQYEPVWMLVGQAKGSDVVARDRALGELMRRLGLKKLSAGEVWTIANEAMDVQGDGKRAWTGLWGQFVENAEAAGLLKREQWQRYARQSVGVELKARPRVRVGDEVPVEVRIVPGRVGTANRFGVQVTGLGMEIGGRRIERYGMGAMTGSVSSAGALGWRVPLAGLELKEGMQVVRQKAKVSVIDWGPQLMGAVVVEMDKELEAKWELVGREVQTVRLIRNEGKREEMEKVLSVKRIMAGSFSPGQLELEVDMQAPPVAAGFDVYVRVGGKEWKVGAVCCKAREYKGSAVGTKLPGDFAGEKVDVVLRASAEAAMQGVDMTEIWDGEVMIRDVRVEWPRR